MIHPSLVAERGYPSIENQTFRRRFGAEGARPLPILLNGRRSRLKDDTIPYVTVCVGSILDGFIEDCRQLMSGSPRARRSGGSASAAMPSGANPPIAIVLR
jgi:hypothetical protein